MTRSAFARPALLLAGSIMAAATAQADPGAMAIAAEVRSLGNAASSAASETRLNDLVNDLSRLRGNPQARALLEELALRKPQIYIKHTEGHTLIPMVDVGAAARVALKTWDRAAAFDRAMLTIRTTRPGLVEQYFSADDIGRGGILEAIAQTDPAGLHAYRETIANALARPTGDALAAAAALALRDSELAYRVIETGSDRVLQWLIPRIPLAYREATALQLLQTALARDNVASISLFRIGALKSRQAEEAVWAHLSDPGLGATAAAILARRDDRATTRRLIELVESSRTALTRQRALLALSLSEDPHARAAARQTTSGP